MEKRNFIQFVLVVGILLITWAQAHAQMKIGKNPNTINKGSILEMEAQDKGVLYPRVSLTATGQWAPLAGTPVEGMTVYNTATVTATSSATTTLTPGFYFWQGSRWNKIATESTVIATEPWRVVGTTIPATTNTQDIYQNGKVAVGFTASDTFTAVGANQTNTFEVKGGDAVINGITIGKGNANKWGNLAVGIEALKANTTGDSNTAMGYRALYSNTTGKYNMANGAYALNRNTEGNNNIATGYQALQYNTTGSTNVAVGINVMNQNKTGEHNIAIGPSALRYNTTGNYNIGIGTEAKTFSNTASYQLSIGNSLVGIGINDNDFFNDKIGIGVVTGINGGVLEGVPTHTLHVKATADPLRLEGLQTSTLTTDKIVVADTNGVLKTLDRSKIALEPWRIVGTTNTAITNTQDIYQQGKVAVGFTNIDAFTAIGAQQTNTFEVKGGDAVVNGITIGRGNANVNSNLAIGRGALKLNTTGRENIAMGNAVLQSNTTGFGNVATGHLALRSNTIGQYNTAMGNVTLEKNTEGSNNIANGHRALQYNTIGSFNIATGVEALYSNTTGIYNLANGYQVLYSNTTGGYNLATGNQALYSNTTGIYNLANGHKSLYSNTTGHFNTVTGHQALYHNTTGSYNIGIGSGAKTFNNTASYQLSIGNSIVGTGINDGNFTNDKIGIGLVTGIDNTNGTLQGTEPTHTLHVKATADPVRLEGLQTSTLTTDKVVVADTNGVLKTLDRSKIALEPWRIVGTTNTATTNTQDIYQNGKVAVGFSNTDAFTAVGAQQSTTFEVKGGDAVINGITIGKGNANKWGNLAVGIEALKANTTGDSNTAMGVYALRNNTTGKNNTAIGLQALLNNTTGIFNTAMGGNTLHENMTGGWNTAIGFAALQGNTEGNYNTATGFQALLNNTTGMANIAVGHQALYFTTTGSNNIAIGYKTLINNTIGDHNIGIGTSAKTFNNTASYQLSIGNSIVGTGINDGNFTNDKIGIGLVTGEDNTNGVLQGTKPTHTLHVKATTDPVRFEGLQSSTLTTDKVVVADAQGVLKTKDGAAAAGIVKGRIACTATATQVIANTAVKAGSVIILTYETPNGGTPISVAVGTRIAGTSFTVIYNTAPPTASYVNYMIIN